MVIYFLSFTLFIYLSSLFFFLYFFFFLALSINCMAVNLGIQFLILDNDKGVLNHCRVDIKSSFVFCDSSGFKLAILLIF